MDKGHFKHIGIGAKLIFYIISFSILSYTIYYLPDYSFLEAMTAEHSAGILNAIGLNAESSVIGNNAYVNDIQIVRECTGVQVIAVFTGLLLPLPKVYWSVKLKSLVLIGFAVYIANVIRIVVELCFLYFGILPWSMAHGFLGDILSVISVFIFLIAADRFIPQIGDFLSSLVTKVNLFIRKKSE